LQPRLPSLFESPHGIDELPTPPADKAHEEGSTSGPLLAPVGQVDQAAKQDITLPGKPATERTPSSERQAGFVFESNTVMASLEKDSGMTIAPPPATENLSVQTRTEPRQTIFPKNQQRETVFSAAPAVETDNAPVVQENAQNSRPGSQLTNEKPIARASAESQPPAESTISSSARKPVLTPQFSPAALASRQNGAQPEQAAQDETVVQVHIGRIEVRAVLPATPSQPVHNGPAAKTKMSLQDYLRQREEKR
jgi:hypothetical protein